jgi:hypothetical protein
MGKTIDEQLNAYLSDAHSIEEQALQQLRGAPDAACGAEIATIFREHLAETDGHERGVRERLEARGGSESKLKDLLMRVGGAGFLLFARAQPDTPEDLKPCSVAGARPGDGGRRRAHPRGGARGGDQALPGVRTGGRGVARGGGRHGLS